jgi:hypothetical protein
MGSAFATPSELTLTSRRFGETSFARACGSLVVGGREAPTWTKLAARRAKSGWDVGIRTPITASRARCPTVERRPSKALCRAAGNQDYTRPFADPASERISSGSAARSSAVTARRRRGSRGIVDRRRRFGPGLRSARHGQPSRRPAAARQLEPPASASTSSSPSSREIPRTSDIAADSRITTRHTHHPPVSFSVSHANDPYAAAANRHAVTVPSSVR